MTLDEKNNLYREMLTIRSGLSFIYENNCKIDEMNEELDEKAQKIRSLDSKLDDILVSYITSTRANPSLSPEISSAKKKFKGYIVGIIVSMAIFILSAILFCLGLKKNTGSLKIAAGVLLGIFLVGIIFSLVGFAKQERIIIGDANNIRKNNSRAVVNNDEAKQINEKIAELRKDLNPDNKDSTAYRYNKEINTLFEQNNAMLELLRKQNNSIVHEADWPYIDLIIHYIETGRADTLKEALQLVDRQLQADSIVNAVQNAAQYISQSFSSAIYSLQSSLDVNLKAISKQINGVSSQLDSISYAQSKISEGIDLQNSLMKNLDVSSAQLKKSADSISKTTRDTDNRIRIEIDRQRNL